MAWAAAFVLAPVGAVGGIGGCQANGGYTRMSEQLAASEDREMAMMAKIDALEGKMAAMATERPPAAAPPDKAQAKAKAKAPAKRPPGPDPKATYKVSAEGAAKGGTAPLVTIVEWSDFQCGFCKRATDTMDALVEQYGDDVRVVYKHNPIGRHGRAFPAAVAAEAARRQGKFWEMHDKLFANSRELTDDNFKAWAAELSLDVDQFERDRNDPALTELVKKQAQEIHALGAMGTPAFFVNGRYVRGAQPLDNFKKLVDEELKEARALVSSGTARDGVYAAVMKTAKTGA